MAPSSVAAGAASSVLSAATSTVTERAEPAIRAQCVRTSSQSAMRPRDGPAIPGMPRQPERRPPERHRRRVAEQDGCDIAALLARTEQRDGVADECRFGGLERPERAAGDGIGGAL